MSLTTTPTSNPAVRLVEGQEIPAAGTYALDPRHEQRDGHLRSGDFFDAEAWPTMTYQSRSVRQVGEGRYIVDGDLTIKGVTKPVPLELNFEGGAADPWGG